VVLTDHTAFYSEESVADLKTQAARNVVEILQGKPPSYPVNKL
jgi:D-3-phosphoglycerate dehydrogenase